MRAIVQDAYGSADALRLAETDRPEVRDGRVVIRVRAAGVDRSVWHFMTGRPYLMRVAGSGLRRPKQRVRGSEVAGVVEEVGPGVTALRPGEEVMGTCVGSFAEYALARPDRLAPKPAGLGFEQAAAVPISGCTALQALRDSGRVRSGQEVLIIGASGGVGTFAVQLAKAYGARVTGVCRTDAMELVRSLGADHVLDHTREEITAGGGRYDLVLDNGGNRSLALLRSVLTPGGTVVFVGGEDGGRWTGGMDRQLRGFATSLGRRQKARMFLATVKRKDLEVLAAMIEAGTVAPVVDRTYPLEQAADALRHLERGHPRGKLVLTV
jgi:NADPH:quinone reductase-like Zn-dependent oxidoreductase